MSDNYSGDIDATDNQERLPPEYQAAIDQPIRLPDYEEWLDSLQPSNDETDGE